MKKLLWAFGIGGLFLMLFIIAVIFFALALANGLDETKVYNGQFALPISITGTIEEQKVTLDISGGIEIHNLKGEIIDDHFQISSDDTEISMEIPGPPARADFFSYMPHFDQSLYAVKLDTSSPQYRLNQMCYTDAEGFRRKGESYLIAMGTYYGDREDIGSQYRLTFEKGNASQEILAVLGDCKSDAHTDALHQYHASSDCTIVEFIMGTRDNQNNTIINEKFGDLVGIAKIGLSITLEGFIEDQTIRISGTANGTPFSAEGTLNGNEFTLNGFYGLGAGGQLLWPINSTIITSEFGYRTDVEEVGGSKNHAGIDIGADIGTPVIAAAAGTIVFAGEYGGYGEYVEIDHGNGLTTCYGHNSVIKVSQGQLVRTGDVIALSGNSGISTGPHLHFEVRIDGVPDDPKKYLKLID